MTKYKHPDLVKAMIVSEDLRGYLKKTKYLINDLKSLAKIQWTENYHCGGSDCY